MKKFYHFLALFIFLNLSAYAQSKPISLTGIISDHETGEPLFGAAIFSKQLEKGTITDMNGSFSLSLPNDTSELTISYLGYEPKIIKCKKDIHTINISLKSIQKELDEVIVTADTYTNELETTQMSVQRISVEEAKTVPALFGEVDMIKVMQLKPGIQSGGEGSSGLYVRGGGPDQNLFLLDGGTIYNASHLFGLFSTFNTDAIDHIELYKGGFPARFGGRLSSVIEIRQRQGNNQKLGISGGIGVISTRLNVEGPIQKGKSSFNISARRTYFDIFTKMINNSNQNNPNYTPIPDYYFYDLNGKFDFQLGNKDHLSISAYQGRDVFGFNDQKFQFDFIWGNRMLNSTWTHNFNKGFRANTSIGYTAYGYEISNQLDEIEFQLRSGITDLSVKTEFDYFNIDRHHIQFGASGINHKFDLGRFSINSNDGDVNFSSGDSYTAQELGLYASDDFIVNEKLSIFTGLRWSGFINEDQVYHGLEPRVSARLSAGRNASFKFGYSKMYQYVHLVSNSGATLPTDFWYPSNNNIRPQSSHQIAGGYSKTFGNGMFLFTNEAYYKWMNNQIDFKDGAQLFVHADVDKEFVFGRGFGYGNEVYIEKQKGRTTGWIGYTLSWAYRQFDEINGGKRFYPRHDRRHDLSIVVSHQLNKKFTLTGTWIYGTGNAVSLPVGRFLIWDTEGSSAQVVPDFQERNNYRMPSYHRMDLGLIYKMFHKWGSSDLTLSIYNVYNRRNPYFIYFNENKNVQSESKFSARQVSLFPIIPSISYNFKF